MINFKACDLPTPISSAALPLQSFVVKLEQRTLGLDATVHVHTEDSKLDIQVCTFPAAQPEPDICTMASWQAGSSLMWFMNHVVQRFDMMTKQKCMSECLQLCMAISHVHTHTSIALSPTVQQVDSPSLHSLLHASGIHGKEGKIRARHLHCMADLNAANGLNIFTQQLVEDQQW